MARQGMMVGRVLEDAADAHQSPAAPTPTETPTQPNSHPVAALTHSAAVEQEAVPLLRNTGPRFLWR